MCNFHLVFPANRISFSRDLPFVKGGFSHGYAGSFCRHGSVKLLVTAVFFFLSALFCNAVAGQSSEIELVDGGVIFGEIISHSDGVYVVMSNSLGTVSVNESEIRLIRPQAGNSAKKEILRTPGGSVSTDLKTLQKSMMNDKEIMGLVLSLQESPEMQELLKDPDIMEAINSGDISALMSNPKFRKLLKNPEIEEIQKKMLAPGSDRK
ncbi:MAG: hypothetical protein H8E19_18915 [Deltaproteobacteria bacterium]|uniref:Uncharacterized protein n=1 Tax=Candidatus Desulfacyla euxinica TaxID=2841693 RepID=A0A8J6TAM7_9DELT|nr:hypothetical protein [Candidatus Desulfacyla euxinica]